MIKNKHRVLIANNDSLQLQAILEMLSTDGGVEFYHVSCKMDIKIASSNLNPDFIIVGYSLQPVGWVDWICELSDSVNDTHFISLIPDIDPAEIAKLRARCFSTILHVVDAKFHLLPTLNRTMGLPYISPVIEAVVGKLPPKDHPLRGLSKTELKITSLILGGYTSKCMMEMLFRSKLTIEGHRRNIKEKLGIFGGKNSLISHLIPYTSWVVSEAK